MDNSPNPPQLSLRSAPALICKVWAKWVISVLLFPARFWYKTALSSPLLLMKDRLLISINFKRSTVRAIDSFAYAMTAWYIASRSYFKKLRLAPHFISALLSRIFMSLDPVHLKEHRKSFTSRAVWMASVEICGRNHNLKSSCDDLFGMVEDTHAITIIKM